MLLPLHSNNILEYLTVYNSLPNHSILPHMYFHAEHKTTMLYWAIDHKLEYAIVPFCNDMRAHAINEQTLECVVRQRQFNFMPIILFFWSKRTMRANGFITVWSVATDNALPSSPRHRPLDIKLHLHICALMACLRQYFGLPLAQTKDHF